MIVSLSDSFRKLATKIYTFALLALALKFLPVEAVSQSGVRIDLQDTSIIVGALSLAALVLTLAAIPCLLRDYLATLVSDHISSDELPGLDATAFVSKGDQDSRGTFLERNFGLYTTLSWLVFVIEAVFPILLGLWIAFIGRQDMVSFLKTITT